MLISSHHTPLRESAHRAHAPTHATMATADGARAEHDSPPSSSSPFTSKFGLLVAGSAAALATYAAFRAKATRAFKAGYVTTWLTLGPAAILYAQPDREELEKKLRASRGAAALPSDEVREAQMAAQFRALRGAAHPATAPHENEER